MKTMILRYIETKALVCLTILLVAAHSSWSQATDPVVIDKIIAKVDDNTIYKSDLEGAYLQYLSNGQPAGSETKCKIFENLVINKLMVAKAEIDSVIVTDEEVDSNLDERMRRILAQIGGDESEVERYYGKSLQQIQSEIRETVQEQLVVQRMQSEITSEIKVTPAEVRTFFKNIPKDSLPYFSAEVAIGQIVKFPGVGKAQKEEVIGKLREIKKQVENGASFEELAKKHSEGPSAPQGGNLGFQKRGDLVPEYEATALQLKPGELSEPVESQFGFHLIQLIERRGNEYNSRHILMRAESSEADVEEAKHYLDSLRNLIVNDSISFEKAAKEYSDDQATATSGGFLMGSTGASYVPTNELDFETFLTIDTMSIGNITAPLNYRMEDGQTAARIILYKDKVSPHQANLIEDYQKIAAATLAKKRNDILDNWFELARSEVFIEIDPEYNTCQILQ
ncbi:MAG: peptidylprolyl isomerase [Cyclobacteriaceae bacterium]